VLRRSEISSFCRENTSQWDEDRLMLVRVEAVVADRRRYKPRGFKVGFEMLEGCALAERGSLARIGRAAVVYCN
jgi:hypothetical protein